MRSDFIANVSHELRTPLSAMKLMLETVLAADDDAEARPLFLPQIGDEVERMIRLVEDLLELARSESGTIPMRRERFDLGDVAAATVNTFAQRAGALGIELDLEAPAAVEVDADRGRLTQVAVNLVDNALRHTPSGGSVVVAVARAGRNAVLRVRDTGAGIPFADLPRVFERFYVVDRSARTTAATPPASGLRATSSSRACPTRRKSKPCCSATAARRAARSRARCSSTCPRSRPSRRARSIRACAQRLPLRRRPRLRRPGARDDRHPDDHGRRVGR